MVGLPARSRRPMSPDPSPGAPRRDTFESAIILSTGGVVAAVSIQLYTLRDQLSSDRDATLAAVAAMGVDEVEPFGSENSDWLPEALAAQGLQAGSAHAGLLADPEKVLAAAKTLGVGTVFQPFFEPDKWLSA